MRGEVWEVLYFKLHQKLESVINRFKWMIF